MNDNPSPQNAALTTHNPAITSAQIAAITGHDPSELALFVEAMTHGSHSQRRSGERDYQRLEFLGDRVLGLAIASELYARYTDEPEGLLSSRLNGLVSRETCADVGRAIGLGPLIRLGKQARDDGARDSENVLGDVVEALIGALYIDGGIEVATRFVVTAWGQRITTVASAPKHPKSALLEWAAAHRRKPPVYTVIARDGPDHAPHFTVKAAIANVGEAIASGTNKQEAERAAAAALLDMVQERRS